MERADEMMEAEETWMLHGLDLLEHILEQLDTHLPCRVPGGRQLPGLVQRLLRDAHTHIPEDLSDL